MGLAPVEDEYPSLTDASPDLYSMTSARSTLSASVRRDGSCDDGSRTSTNITAPGDDSRPAVV
jgi:hypothetical protein